MSQPRPTETRLKVESRGPDLPGAHPFAALARILEGFCRKGRAGLIMFVSLAGFALIVNSSWNATPDSALYLSLGESLARGEGYVFNGTPHTYVPPGYPFLVAAAAKAGGPGFLSYRVLMALLGAAAAIAGALFAYTLLGRDVALWVGGLFAVNHVLLHNSTLTLSDAPFALAALVALTISASACTRELRPFMVLVAALSLSILPLMRINGLGIPVGVAVGLLAGWRNRPWSARLGWLALFLVIAFAPAAAWHCWKASLPHSAAEGDYWNAIVGRHFHDQMWVVLTSAWGHFRETNYALTGLNIWTGFLELIVPAVVIAGIIDAFRQGDRFLVPVTVIQYAGISLSSAGSRYLIFLIPALYLFFALGLVRTVEWLQSRSTLGVSPRRFLAWTFVVLCVCNVGHNLRSVYHAQWALERNGPETLRSLPFFKAGRWLRQAAPAAPVLTSKPRMIHYLSGNPTVAVFRSGVPNHEIYVQQRAHLARLIAARRPRFVFVDRKDAAIFQQIREVLERGGRGLEFIPEGSSPPRYQLFRIVSQGSPLSRKVAPEKLCLREAGLKGQTLSCVRGYGKPADLGSVRGTATLMSSSRSSQGSSALVA